MKTVKPSTSVKVKLEGSPADGMVGVVSKVNAADKTAVVILWINNRRTDQTFAWANLEKK